MKICEWCKTEFEHEHLTMCMDCHNAHSHELRELRKYGTGNRTRLDVKGIKQRLNMDRVTGWSSVVAYIRAGHGLTALKAETPDWSEFLAKHEISVSRDHRARLLAKHDVALLRAVPQVDSLTAALDLCQRIEDEPKPAPTMAADAPQPVKMGRPRKSESEKWRTRLMRVLADAPDSVGVYIEADGNNIEILF